MHKNIFKNKSVLILFGLLLSIVLLESGMRLTGFLITAAQEYQNQRSLRKKGAYRILCVGESTTAGGKDSYPFQLEEILNQGYSPLRFTVINKGKGAVTSTEIVNRIADQLEYYHPDMVIVMMGINDNWDILQEKDPSRNKLDLFLSSWKTYKLIKFVYLSLVNKTYIHKNKRTLLSFDGRRVDYAKKAAQESDSRDDGFGETGPPSAEETLKESLRNNPKDETACLELGRFYIDHSDYDNAEKTFQRALELNPYNFQTYVDLGRVYEYKQDFNKAERMYQTSLRIMPRGEWSHIRLAEVYWRKKEYLRMEQVLLQLVRINPKSDKGYGMLAHCYWDWGRPELSRKCFREADELRMNYFLPITKQNYNRLKDALTQKGIRFVCMQYPFRQVDSLKKIFDDPAGIIFVDNEGVFKRIRLPGNYHEYFSDSFAGDFGHCILKGNRLLAENIARVIAPKLGLKRSK